MKKNNPSQAVARLEDDMLVLRSQLDSRPAGGGELEAFRAQMSHNIASLQSQVQQLQQRLNAR